MKKKFLVLCLLSQVSCLFSQPKFRVLNIPVEKNSVPVREPWVGGMDAPQFSPCDLNHDGIQDLFVFDKIGDKVLTYINLQTGTDTTFKYAPQYEELFPRDLFSWALIRDYNYDNVPDIFAHANTGTMVYKGTEQNGNLHFDVVSPLLKYLDPPFSVNVYTNVDDLPVFTDVNYDGDIDVLTYGVTGYAVEYYENQTIEHLGNPSYAYDSLQYLLYSRCWGGFSQGALNNSIHIHDSICIANAFAEPSSNNERHAGNTLFSVRQPETKAVDLLNGNIGFNTLAFLHNCGDTLYADVCGVDSFFPNCDIPVDMYSCPAAFGFDANNDGEEDLLISQSARTAGRNVKNVMFYQRSDPACGFHFTYETDSFLVEHMLDFGSDSKPVLFDYNGDGLMDIVVGNYGYFRPFTTYQSKLALLENIGTLTEPKFKLRTDDYAGLSITGLVGIHPAFGDLDGDGLKDMLIGDLNGNLQFYKNAGGATASFPSITVPQLSSIDVGQYSDPLIYDLNGDSLLDLLVGKYDGKIAYYRNMGTKTNPVFHKDSVNKTLGGINVCVSGYIYGSSSPFLLDDSTLLVGNLNGNIYSYRIDRNNLESGLFTRLDSNVIGHDVGGKAAVAVYDFNNDGKPDYVIGNSRGGLLFYSDTILDTTTLLAVNEIPEANEHTLHIYPNPAKEFFICTLSEGEFIHPQAEVYNLLGERMQTEISVSGKAIRLSTASLSNGFYFVRIAEQGKSLSGKILIAK